MNIYALNYLNVSFWVSMHNSQKGIHLLFLKFSSSSKEIELSRIFLNSMILGNLSIPILSESLRLSSQQIISIKSHKLPKNCDADNYAYLMFRDKYNLLSTYVNLSLEDIEKFLL